MILAGDIGGTKTLLAVFDSAGSTRELQRDATYPSQESASLEAILARFLGGAPTPVRAACFGVPGVVTDGHCETTNLPWTLDERDLAQHIGAPRVKLLPALRSGRFMEAFTAKGRFAEWLHRIPVNVALNPRAPLLGAARYALRLVSAA